MDPPSHSGSALATPQNATGRTAAESEGMDDSGSEYLIVLPCIIAFGLCGNIISLVAIFHTRLRKMPANQYLIVLTTADSMFLAFLLLVLIKADFVGYWMCVGIEYVLMTASYVSSWSIAALTLERYFAIVHPLKHIQYGDINRWRLMSFWLPIPFLLNVVQFVVLIPNATEEERKCVLRDGNLQLVVEMADVVLCYLLPCLIVVALNLIIASNVQSAGKGFPPHSSYGPRTSSHKDRHATANGQTSRSTNPRKINATQPSADAAKFSITHSGRFANKKRPLSSHSPSSSGSTRILLIVPIVYILLNTPFYLIRLCDTIALNLFDSKVFSVQHDGGLGESGGWMVLLYNLAHYLYYVNFACDVVVYAFSSSNFRHTVVSSWRRLLYRALHIKKPQQNSEYLGSTKGNAYLLSTRLQPSNSNSMALMSRGVGRSFTGGGFTGSVMEGQTSMKPPHSASCRLKQRNEPSPSGRDLKCAEVRQIDTSATGCVQRQDTSGATESAEKMGTIMKTESASGEVESRGVGGTRNPCYDADTEEAKRESKGASVLPHLTSAHVDTAPIRVHQITL